MNRYLEDMRQVIDRLVLTSCVGVVHPIEARAGHVACIQQPFSGSVRAAGQGAHPTIAYPEHGRQIDVGLRLVRLKRFNRA